jgi:glucose/arabinose dehydrogenase
MRVRSFFLILILLLTACGKHDDSAPAAPAPTREMIERDGPPCDYSYWGPFHRLDFLCMELVYENVPPAEAAPELTGLAFAPDGTLYMARTAWGEIWAMQDKNGDHFYTEADEVFKVVGDLRLPLALTVYDGSVYVLLVDGVVRLDDTDEDAIPDTTVTLIEDLPGGETGFWPGSIGIGPDGRLYISTGASCTACANPDPGQLLSYTLKGSDQRVEATGFRQPTDFTWHPETGELWILDTAPQIEGLLLREELNRWVRGADYGFPTCYNEGVSPTPGADCSQSESSVLLIQVQSNPSGMAFYTSDELYPWTGDLLMVARGSWNLAEPAGYWLMAFDFEDGEPTNKRNILAPYADPPPVGSMAEYSLSGRGFFPARPVDIAISPNGWIYISIEEGRILRFRPRALIPAP